VVYLDTSFITPYYLNEASSEAVAQVLEAIPAGQLATSDWTLVEFASMLARRVRQGDLDQPSAEETMRLFVDDAQAALVILEPVRADFTLARRLVLATPKLGLRAPDALHLALSANYGLSLHTLDRKLTQAAHSLGLNATDAGILGEP
jgi:uncharacterized protein